MKMIWHQNEAPNEVPPLKSCAAEILKSIKDAVIRQDGSSPLNASRHEIERPISKHPIQPLEPPLVL